MCAASANPAEPSRSGSASLLWILGGAALLATLPFWLTDLDLRTAAIFYDPAQPDFAWPEGDRPLWRFFYYAIPWVTALIGFCGLGLVSLGTFRERHRRLRLYGVFLFLVVILGPGLVINAVFKDNFGRPRPRQVEGLGGHLPYQPPLEPGRTGKSFPCGHCSVAFALGAFYLIFRRHRPALAWLSLIVSLIGGVMVGLGRLAAGGHFLSDTLWAGIFVWLVMGLLYFKLLKIPEREAFPERFGSSTGDSLKRPLQIALLSVAGAALLFGVLLATPRSGDRELSLGLNDAGFPAELPTPLRLSAEYGDVRLILEEGGPSSIRARLHYTGFGLPIARMELGQRTTPDGELFIFAKSQSIFTEVTGELVFRVPVSLADTLTVEVRRGDLSIEQVVTSSEGENATHRDGATAGGTTAPLIRARVLDGEIHTSEHFPAERLERLR